MDSCLRLRQSYSGRELIKRTVGSSLLKAAESVRIKAGRRVPKELIIERDRSYHDWSILSILRERYLAKNQCAGSGHVLWLSQNLTYPIHPPFMASSPTYSTR